MLQKWNFLPGQHGCYTGKKRGFVYEIITHFDFRTLVSHYETVSNLTKQKVAVIQSFLLANSKGSLRQLSKTINIPPWKTLKTDLGWRF